VDLRTVAGRLGHGGGGTTTLKVYAAGQACCWRDRQPPAAARGGHRSSLAGMLARRPGRWRACFPMRFYISAITAHATEREFAP
jgi:hypothetical protein